MRSDEPMESGVRPSGQKRVRAAGFTRLVLAGSAIIRIFQDFSWLKKSLTHKHPHPTPKRHTHTLIQLDTNPRHQRHTASRTTDCRLLLEYIHPHFSAPINHCRLLLRREQVRPKTSKPASLVSDSPPATPLEQQQRHRRWLHLLNQRLLGS